MNWFKRLFIPVIVPVAVEMTIEALEKLAKKTDNTTVDDDLVAIIKANKGELMASIIQDMEDL